MNGIYLLLGSNMGDRLVNLKTAIADLRAQGVRVLDESSVYETEPWGKPDQSWFLNVVVHVGTALSPSQLLSACMKTEANMGRIRSEKWGERLIDIDILYYFDKVIDGEQLSVPHPGIPARKFTLIPLCELCAGEEHPMLGQTQAELLSSCNDDLNCNLTDYQL